MNWRRLVRLGMLEETAQTLQQSFEDALGQAIKRQESFEGVTDAAGVWTVLFVTPFTAVPHLTAELVNPDVNTSFRVTALTVTGFSLHVFRRTVINVLGFQLPSFVVQNVAGQSCTAVAIQR